MAYKPGSRNQRNGRTEFSPSKLTLRTASPTRRSFATPIAPPRVTDGGARVGRVRRAPRTHPSPANRDFVSERRSRKHPRWPQSATFGGYSASGDAPRMTEGEGSTAAIDDAAAKRPSPANAPRVAATLSPLSLRPLRLFGETKSEPTEILRIYNSPTLMPHKTH